MTHPFFFPPLFFFFFFPWCGKKGLRVGGERVFLLEGSAKLTPSPYPLVVVCLDYGGYGCHKCACSLLFSASLVHLLCHVDPLHVFFNISTFLSTFFPLPVPIIKTEPSDEYDSLGTAGLSMHSKPYFSQPRLTPIMPVADPDACLVGGYPPCPPRHAAIPSSSPSSSPTLHDLSPVAYSKCLPHSPTHAAPPGPLVPSIQETPGRSILTHPASPDHSSSLGMLHSQGSPSHLNSPGPHGFNPIYANSSPSSSPVSHPSTPGGAVESPFIQAYSPSQAAQAGGSSPTLLREDSSPPSMAITVKQEPQELDQMYLDDGELHEIRRAHIVGQ